MTSTPCECTHVHVHARAPTLAPEHTCTRARGQGQLGQNQREKELLVQRTSELESWKESGMENEGTVSPLGLSLSPLPSPDTLASLGGSPGSCENTGATRSPS